MQQTFKESLVMLLKGAFLILISALIGVLVFSAVVKIAGLDANVIKPVNQFIKILAVFLGCFFSVKGSMGFIKGALCGILGTIIIFLVFALIGGELSFGLSFLVDLLLGAVVGAVSGIVTVNVRK